MLLYQLLHSASRAIANAEDICIEDGSYLKLIEKSICPKDKAFDTLFNRTDCFFKLLKGAVQANYTGSLWS